MNNRLIRWFYRSAAIKSLFRKDYPSGTEDYGKFSQPNDAHVGAKRLATAFSDAHLARMLMRSGENKDQILALSLLTKASVIVTDQIPKDDVRKGEILASLGECYLLWGHIETALQFLKQATDIFERSGTYSPDKEIAALELLERAYHLAHSDAEEKAVRQRINTLQAINSEAKYFGGDEEYPHLHVR